MPPFLSTSHCEFYDACCATTHDKPPFPRPIHPFSRELIPSLFEELITQSSSTLVQPSSDTAL